MHLFKLTDEQLTQILIPKRFVPPTPSVLERKGMVYVFDSEDKFELTYDELVEIISKARMAGPKLIPVLGTVN
ncbi:hypothetical protein F4W09_15020 [Acinetobacter tandoii]|uniref:Uncharacterized protein n=1 Tax=Acinetobacter tandoii TaxID=202954 RepID=A0A5N4W9U1_9GAMM|nr:hypothetical protein [Acinetobacter tandoii]KAB1852309.1 hypothetical protein F4W09_15020 [Acinetobacter tandoii]